jgi:circadian clock protein KaiC
VSTAETDHAGITPGQPLAGVNQTGLSAVAENIIALHLAALRSETHRLMTVLKSRDRRTDMRMRRFDIVQGGIVLDADHQRAEGILRDISSQGAPPPPSGDLRLTGA